MIDREMLRLLAARAPPGVSWSRIEQQLGRKEIWRIWIDPPRREEIVMIFTDEQMEVIRRIVREELRLAENRGPKMGTCAWCEGQFPESALNYSSGDPACNGCQRTFNPKPLR